MQLHGWAPTLTRLTANWRPQSSTPPGEFVPNFSTIFYRWRPLMNWPIRHCRW